MTVPWRLPLAFAFALSCTGLTIAQQDESPPGDQPGAGRQGRMITIKGVIDTGLKNRVIHASRAAVREGAEVIIFDMRASPSDFGPCYDLASAIVELGGNVKRTVAFVDQDLSGHAVLIALACREIVMSPSAKIGNAFGDDSVEPSDVEENAYRQIAARQHHTTLLARAMISRKLRLLEITTAGVRSKQFLDADDLPEFEKGTRVVKTVEVKPAGDLLFLDADKAKRFGLINRTAESRKEVAAIYGLPETVTAGDTLLQEAYRPVVLKLDGRLDARAYQYVLRRIQQARGAEHNLVFVAIDSADADVAAAGQIAHALESWDVKKVAWVAGRATGPSVLVVFACDELVIAADARLGDFRPDGTTPEEYRAYADTAMNLASGSSYPDALVRGMVDPNTTVFEVKSVDQPGLRGYRTEEELNQPEIAARWTKARPGAISVRELDGREAVSLELAVATAGTIDELKSLYDLGDRVPVLQPGWVDTLVDALTSTAGTVFLLVLAFVCIYLELQMPGFGVAGTLATICFVMFFWSRWLADTAHSLEIVMFLLGMALIAIELFVIPGFGVTGVFGFGLLLASLVLASQSFYVPQSTEDAWTLIRNMTTLAASLFVAIGAIVGIARYLPRMPVLNRMMLAPPEQFDAFMTDSDASAAGPAAPYQELLGQRGTTTTPLRPSGHMKFGGRTYDVVAQGDFIESGRPVEVIEIYQNRIIVRSAAEH